MNPIRIDNEIYYVQESSEFVTEAKANLKKILVALASLSLDNMPNVRSETLQELLGLKTRSPYEFRLNGLIKTGHLQRQESVNLKLEALAA